MLMASNLAVTYLVSYSQIFWRFEYNNNWDVVDKIYDKQRRQKQYWQTVDQ